MDPLVIALICAFSFGVVVAVSAFIRQLILSRDKRLNDEAQHKALSQETLALEKIREQMSSNQRFNSHYQVLGSNKEAIIYLDNKIDEILRQKTQLIERYAQVTQKESESIINTQPSASRKEACDRLKKQIDEEMNFYDSELAELQQRRGSLWASHAGLQDHILQQEKARNDNLDALYQQHSGVLEKIYLRHADDSEQMTKQMILAGNLAYKSIILAPLQFISKLFTPSAGISLTQAIIERTARANVGKAESDLNQSVFSNQNYPRQTFYPHHDEAEPSQIDLEQRPPSFNGLT